MPKKAAAPKPDPNQTPPAAPAPEPTPSAPPDGAAPPADAQPGTPEQPAPPPADPDAGTEQVLQEDASASKAEPSAAVPAPESVPDLDDFITTHEKSAQTVDLVITAISYPGAQARHHHGIYSGFPIAAGELQATYSDGSKH